LKADKTQRKLLFWRSVSVCALLAFFISLIIIFRIYSGGSAASDQQSENALEGIFVIDVIDVDPNRGKHGQYFIFDPKAFDELYGASGWEGAEFLALNKSTAKFQNIIVWRVNPRDAATQGFGKQMENSKAGDWKIGDSLIVLMRATNG